MPVFADHPRRRLHGRQRTGRPRRALHIKETDLRSIRRKSGRIHIALQLGQPHRGGSVKLAQIDIFLAVGRTAVGKERERLRVGLPCHRAHDAVLIRLRSDDGHALALLQVVYRRYK